MKISFFSCFETRTRNRKWYLKVEREKIKLILTGIPGNGNSHHSLPQPTCESSKWVGEPDYPKPCESIWGRGVFLSFSSPEKGRTPIVWLSYFNDWCLLCICGSEIRCVFLHRQPCVAGMCGNMRCPPQIWPSAPYLPVNTRPASSSPPSSYLSSKGSHSLRKIILRNNKCFVCSYGGSLFDNKKVSLKTKFFRWWLFLSS